MEQHSRGTKRQDDGRDRRGGEQGPGQPADGRPDARARPTSEATAVYRAQPRFPHLPAPLGNALSWLPRPRLTALGCGLFAVLLMLLTGGLDHLLLDDSATAYGVVFLLVAALTTSWVRPTDLLIGPVAAPIAFGAGLFFISDSGGAGALGHLLGMFPTLAVNAFWLYGGTLLAIFVALVRKVSQIALRRAQDRAYAEGTGQLAQADPGEGPWSRPARERS